MFTGIIENLGRVNSVHGDQLVIELPSDQLPSGELALGESISVQGVCLTIAEWNPPLARFSVSPETFSKTNLASLKEGEAVHIERALLPSKPLGGHFVQGHVDGVGKCLSIAPDSRNSDCLQAIFQVSPELAKYLVAKGSITIDGVSLTINEVSIEPATKFGQFSIQLIPHTVKNTRFQNMKAGDQVNIEIDILAKYVQAHLERK